MSKRIEYIDAMRGFTMFLVILGHVFLFSLNCTNSNFFNDVIITFHVPLFFFISGIIVSRSNVEKDTLSCLQAIFKKTRVLLIPTVVFFFFHYTFLGNGALNHFMDFGFGKFWFTFVLFEYFVIYYSIVAICGYLKISEFMILIPLATICVGITLLHYDDYQICRMLSVRDMITYLPYFVCGLYTRKNLSVFYRCIEKDNVKTILLLAFVFLLIIIHGNFQDYFLLTILSKVGNVYLVRWIGMFLVLSIFIGNKNYFANNSRISKIMLFVGRRTLDIYMLHYFFLPDLLFLGCYFQTGKNQILLLFVGLLISCYVLLLSLAVSWIIRNSNFCAHYLFGTKRVMKINR